MNEQKLSKDAETKPDGYTLLADAVFRPILFSTPMVQAILNFTKTLTRRTQGLEEINENPDQFIFERRMAGGQFVFIDKEQRLKQWFIKPKFNEGDIMWVRETFAKMFEIHEELVGKDREDMGYWYKTDGELSEASFYIEGYKWKPSIFMPKEACRLFLKVTNVRVERLQNISVDDAIKEGLYKEWDDTNYWYQNYSIKLPKMFKSPLKSFQSLWQSINGKDSWNKNHWVWVYEFEQIDRPSGFC